MIMARQKAFLRNYECAFAFGDLYLAIDVFFKLLDYILEASYNKEQGEE